jgi:hypothetical protein
MNDQAVATAESTNPMIRDITIQGQELEVEVPYTEGHVLTKAEASQLNQVYLENIGNNFRNKVKEMLDAGAAVDAIQAELDKYASEYEFGTRRVSTASPKRTTDPVMKEARALAKKALVDFFKKKDIAFADLPTDDKEQAIKTYFERHGEKVMAIAARRVADAADMAAAGL